MRPDQRDVQCQRILQQSHLKVFPYLVLRVFLRGSDRRFGHSGPTREMTEKAVIQVELPIHNLPRRRINAGRVAVPDRPRAIAAELRGVFFRIFRKLVAVGRASEIPFRAHPIVTKPAIARFNE